MTTAKKLIPKFLTPTEQTREIDGQPVTVRRLPARRAPDVLGRLLGDVGPVVAEIMSSPDKELDPEIEGAIRGMVASKDGADAGLGLSMTIIKALIFSDAVSKIKGFDFGWYVSQMLPGCMAVGGVDIDSFEELDETGIGPLTMFEIFRFACEVNFFPTFAGRNTNAGSPGQIQTPPACSASPIRGSSNLRGATASAGQPDQTLVG